MRQGVRPDQSADAGRTSRHRESPFGGGDRRRTTVAINMMRATLCRKETLASCTLWSATTRAAASSCLPRQPGGSARTSEVHARQLAHRESGNDAGAAKIVFPSAARTSQAGEYCIQPNAKHLAAALDVREEDVVMMLERFAGGETSLETPRNAGDAGSRTVGDSLRAESASQPDIRVETDDGVLQTRLATFGRTLCGRDLAIFRQRLLPKTGDVADLPEDRLPASASASWSSGSRCGSGSI